jgi:hypothetical protein
MFAAMRLASSLLSSLAADRRIGGSGGRPFAICHEMNDRRCYAADQKSKYDDDDRLRDRPPH